IAAGRYQVSAVGTSATAPVRLGPGDQLLLTLTSTPRGPEFRRLPFGADYSYKPFADSDRGDWRLSVLQNKRAQTGGVRMLATLEKTASEIAEVARPVETWFELGTDLDVSTPMAVDVSTAWGYPAPAWDVSVPGWPNAAATGSPARP